MDGHQFGNWDRVARESPIWCVKMKYLVVESNDISRAGLTALLTERGLNVQNSTDYSLLVSSDVDEHIVFLVGMNEENQNHVTEILEASRARPGRRANILCISAFPSLEQCDLLSSLGVLGYCSVHIKTEVLMLAINAVESGAFFICPRIHEKRMNQSRKRKHEGDELSPREMDVLVQLVNGSSNQEIAKQLNISVETVKAHVKSILAKLAVHDRTQAVIKAIKFGLVEYLQPKVQG